MYYLLTIMYKNIINNEGQYKVTESLCYLVYFIFCLVTVIVSVYIIRKLYTTGMYETCHQYFYWYLRITCFENVWLPVSKIHDYSFRKYSFENTWLQFLKIQRNPPQIYKMHALHYHDQVKTIWCGISFLSNVEAT